VGADPKKSVFRDADEAGSEIRERQPTLTDEVALEQARLMSIPSEPEDLVPVLRAELEPMDRVPSLAGPLQDVGAALDPTSAFVLGFVDGVLPLETIIDVAGLPEPETLSILARMIREGVIVFRPPPPSAR
jgi:hypothetical protein